MLLHATLIISIKKLPRGCHWINMYGKLKQLIGCIPVSILLTNPEPYIIRLGISVFGRYYKSVLLAGRVTFFCCIFIVQQTKTRIMICIAVAGLVCKVTINWSNRLWCLLIHCKIGLTEIIHVQVFCFNRMYLI